MSWYSVHPCIYILLQCLGDIVSSLYPPPLYGRPLLYFDNFNGQKQRRIRMESFPVSRWRGYYPCLPRTYASNTFL
ncbi:hypothetical protein HDV62DRAFT_352270 [Trichoderma sp. SZMC 28011]